MPEDQWDTPWEVNPVLPYTIRQFNKDRTECRQIAVCKAHKDHDHVENAHRIAALYNFTRREGVTLELDYKPPKESLGAAEAMGDA